MQHNYEAIVQTALTEPGKIAAAYSALHDFSIGNQWLAIMQLGRPEPIATLPAWKAVGRTVTRGQKAIELIMPVVKKVKAEVTETRQDEGSMFFIARRHWFGLSQTQGAEYVPNVPGFDIDKCIAEIGITKEPYQSMSGNSMGYAKTAEKIIAVSLLAFDPLKTSFHEIAHVLLHPNLTSDHEALRRDVKEIEAELTAYLVKMSLGHTANLEFSRGYIQNWMADTTLEKVRFPKVFAAADTILKAGRGDLIPVEPIRQAAGRQQGSPAESVHRHPEREAKEQRGVKTPRVQGMQVHY
jgi:hypothetical protein